MSLDQTIQNALCRYVDEMFKPISAHFAVLEQALGRNLTEQVSVALVSAMLRMEGVSMGAIPNSAITAAVRMAIWPPAELPFDCARLVSGKGAKAVRDLLKVQCGARRRGRLPEGPRRAGVGAP